MIRPLRQRHRRIVIALGVLLPAVFAVGIAERKSVPIAAGLPPALTGDWQRFDAAGRERNDLFVKAPVRASMLRERNQAGHLAIRLSATKDFVKPDLIVYWVPGTAGIASGLPDAAILLGSFSAPALPIPDDVAKPTGSLVLYSLADNEVVDVSKPFAFSESTE